MPSAATTPRQTTKRSRERYLTLIDAALRRALRSAPGAPGVLEEAMHYCVFSGGKRFRPLLCLGACEAVGGEGRRALSAACAVELIHTYSLVHDDLPAMDDADERRGRASCHRKFGEATAILVGDALLTRAFELFGADGMPNTLKILQVVGRASGTSGLIGGQVLDLQANDVRKFRVSPAPARVGPGSFEFRVNTAKKKTGALITASVVAGGLAGGASAADVKRLERFGQRLGLAFQVKDDLHDGDGVVKAIGRATAERQAGRLLEQARRDLTPFGRRAWLLFDLTDWLANS